MGQLRDKMHQEIRLRGDKSGTARKYLGHIHKFVAHFLRCPTTMGEDQIRTFLLDLMEEEHAPPSTVANHVAALRFLHGMTLGRPEVAVLIHYPQLDRRSFLTPSLGRCWDAQDGHDNQRLRDAQAGPRPALRGAPGLRIGASSPPALIAKLQCTGRQRGHGSAAD